MITAKPKRKQGRRKTRIESCSENWGGIFFTVLRLNKFFEVYTIANGFRNSSSNNSIKTKNSSSNNNRRRSNDRNMLFPKALLKRIVERKAGNGGWRK